MTDDFELRLINATTPDGEVGLADLAAIAHSLQELSLRLTRSRIAIGDHGRPSSLVSELSQLRLTGLSTGSTRLMVARGPAAALDVTTDEIDDIDRRFEEIIGGIAEGHRPDWVSDSVAESAGHVVKALSDAAPTVEARFGSRPSMRIDTQHTPRNIWQPAPDVQTPEAVVVTGSLYAVDLRRGKFRIVDDVNHQIILEEVQDSTSAAQRFIGHRVIASGEGTRDANGLLRSLLQPTIDLEALPDSWMRPQHSSLDAELAKPGPQIDGGAELTDDEYADFIDLING